MIKSGPLSDPDVVAVLDEAFVPVFFDPSDPTTAGKAPGLKMWEKSYVNNWAYRQGFATSLVLSSDGMVPLVAANIAKHHWRDVGYSANHLPEESLGLLARGLARQERYAAIQAADPVASLSARRDLERLQREIIDEIQATSRGNDGRTITLQ